MLQRTRGRSGIPVHSVIASCAVAVFMALINFVDFLRPKDVLDTLMNITGMVAMLVYLVIACSQLRMRGKLRAEGKEPLVRMWLFPWLTWAVIIFIVAALITMVFVDEYRTVVLSTGAAAGGGGDRAAAAWARRGRAPAGRADLKPPGRRSPARLSVCNRGRVGPWSRYFSRWNNPYARLFY